MPTRTTMWVASAVVVMAMVGAGCSGDDDEPSSSSGSQVTVAESTNSSNGTTPITREKQTPEMDTWMVAALPVLEARYAATGELSSLLATGSPEGISLFCIGQVEAVGAAETAVVPVPNPSVDGLVVAYLAAQRRLFEACSPGTPEAVAAAMPLVDEVASLERSLQAELREYVG